MIKHLNHKQLKTEQWHVIHIYHTKLNFYLMTTVQECEGLTYKSSESRTARRISPFQKEGEPELFVYGELICNVSMYSDDLSRLFVHSPRTCPSINVNILPSSTLTGNWQSVISWMLINNEYPCHCLNTQNIFKWWNYKSGVCFVRTVTAFSFSPCIKERNKIPYSDTAHHLCYQSVLYFLKTIHLYLSWNFESYLLGYMIFYNNNTQYNDCSSKYDRKSLR